MSYLVLALGTFLSLCGALAVYAGYGIIQVERGWASVIAGSMAFSCGIVTLALGLILHKLSSMHASLKSGEGFAPPRELTPQMASEPRREYAPPFTPGASMMPEAVPPMAAAPPPAIPPAASVRSWPQRSMRSNLAAARNFLKTRGTVLPAARGTAESDYPSQNVPPLARGGLKMSQPSVEPPSEPGFAMPAEVAVAKAVDEAVTQPAFAPAGETHTERAWREDEEPGLFDEATADQTDEPPVEQALPEMRYNPGEPEAQAEAGVTWQARTASIDKIFEEEILIELEQALDSRTGGAEPPAASIEQASLDLAPPDAGAGAAAVREPSPEPPPPVSGAGQEELAIVGQYESEGTSYVMYSDGSIEARTERSVFHFKSMAELKTFMEAEARTPQE